MNNKETAKGQSLPVDLEAERNFLGALISDGSLLMKINDSVGRINVEDFSSERNKLVYKTILTIAKSSSIFDAITLSDLLETNGFLEKAGGRKYITELAKLTSPKSAVSNYAKIIIDKARRRRLISAVDSINQMAYVPEGRTATDIFNEAQGIIFNLAQESRDEVSGPKPIIPVVSDIIKKITNPEAEQPGVNTGFVEFDNLTRGLQPGSLNIVAARPGMGKTSFAMNIVSNIALNRDVVKPALIFSLEMPIDQLVVRMLSSFGRVSMADLQASKINDEQWKSIFRKLSLLTIEEKNATTNVIEKKNKVYIDDSGDITPLELRARALQLASLHGGLSVIMVDYIQLMKGQTKAASRSLEVGEISRSLKMLAKELNIPIIALSQLNREVEGRKDHRPMNSDLRESGSLEQDADMILFLHREYAYTKNDEDLSKALLIVSKNRNGATKDIELQFQGEYTTFYDVSNPYADADNESAYDEAAYGYMT